MMTYPSEIGRKQIKLIDAIHLLHHSASIHIVTSEGGKSIQYGVAIELLFEMQNNLWIPLRRFDTLHGIRSGEYCFQTDNRKLQKVIDGYEATDN